MAQHDLQLDLRAAIQRAAARGTATVGQKVTARPGGDFQSLVFSVHPLSHADATAGLLLFSFQPVVEEIRAKPEKDGPPGSEDDPRIQELRRDLDYTRENLHATIEELQASNEELKSTNEEMQSTNEELQSTNEELETSKEELQSLNEELVTVNRELQANIEQLAGMQNDMKNLLDNINIGTVFLDSQLTIRRFTRDAVHIYHLVPSDVGRPLGEVKSYLADDDLLAAAQATLNTLAPYEAELGTAKGTWYRARIQPYRTLDNVIDGVVLTFIDITEMKHVREDLRTAQELAESIVDTVREPLLVLNHDLQVVSASRSFYQHFDLVPEQVVGRAIYEVDDRRWDVPTLRELLETVLPRDRSFDDFAMEQEDAAHGRTRMLLSARRIVNKAQATDLILLAIEIRPSGERVGA